MDKSKDNYIQFKDITISNYDLKGHSVTDDDWDGISFEDDTLDIKAGRKMGHDPAATFAQGLSITNMFGLDVDLSASPNELHFTTYGTMSFDIPTDDGS